MKLLLTYLLLCVTCALNAGSFTIYGNVQGTTANEVYLRYMDAVTGERITDTATVAKGKFKLTGTVSGPTAATITLGNFVEEFFFETGDTYISGNVTSRRLIFSGGVSTWLYNEHNNRVWAYVEERDSLAMVLYGPDVDSITKAQNMPRFTELAAVDGKLVKEFVGKYPNTVVSAYLVYRIFSNATNVHIGDSLINLLTEDVQQSIYAKLVREQAANTKKQGQGAAFIHFSVTNEKGDTVSTKAFLGKYVLIDFWASWCAPCRGQNPYIAEAYKKYKDKGFEVLGVSSDIDKQKWLTAVKEDNMNWPNGIPVEFGDKSPFRVYGIRMIPANFLLDPEGKIVAKNLRSGGIEAKLAEVFEGK